MRTFSLTIDNINAKQFEAITRLLNAPEPTVSPDEDENFGKNALTEEDLADGESPTRTKKRRGKAVKAAAAKDFADTEDGDETQESEEAESTLEFGEVKRVINAYGNQFPELMRGILQRAGVKSTKLLEEKPELWQEVYDETLERLEKFEKSTKSSARKRKTQ